MFASLLRADAGGDRSPWGDWWFQAVGRRSSSGQRVTPDRAMALPTVFSCVRVLSESMASLPFRLYRSKVGGGRLQVGDHWLVRLFKRPNPFQNRVEWRQMVQGHVALRGNAYNRIVEDGKGGIAALLPIHPDRIKPVPLTNGDWRWEVEAADGTKVTLMRDEVWHLRTMSTDGILGISPVGAQSEAIGGALGAQDYANRFWQNDGKPTGGWLEYPGKIPNDAQRTSLKEKIRDAVSGANAHRMLVLDQGMKYHEVGLTNKDSQFIEARGLSRTELCAIWRMPPHKVGILDRATFSNIEQQDLEFWGDTMLPWVDLWQATAEALLDSEGPDADLEVVFDMRSRMRGDAASRSTYINSGVLNGWLTRNEGRSMEGLDPIEGLDEPLVPVNEMTLEQSENPEPVQPPGVDQPAKEAPAEPDEDDAPKKKKGAERLEALLAGSAERMARRIAKGDTPPAATLAAALAIPEASAVAWLAENGSTATAWPLEMIVASLRALGNAA